jgi:hypothetical protein
MSEQTISNKIGNAIGECKKRLLDRVKDGADAQTAISLFFAELRLEMDRIEDGREKLAET